MTSQDRESRRERRLVIDASATALGGGLSFAQGLLPHLEVGTQDLKPLLVCSQRNVEALSAKWNGEIALFPSSVGLRVPLQEALGVLFPNAVLLCTANRGPLTYGSGRTVVVLQNISYFTPAESRFGLRGRMNRTLVKASIARSAEVVAISDTLRNAVASVMPSVREKVVTVRCGVLKPSPAVRPCGLKTRDKFLLVVANGMPHKRLDLVVEGWRDASISGLDLVIVGEFYWPEIQPHLRSLAHGALGRLELLGAIANRSELSWLYENAELLVSASDSEAFGMTPGEALLHGCPTLISDIKSHREICGTNATYFQSGNALDLASKLRASATTLRIRPQVDDLPTWEDASRRIIALIRLNIRDE